MRINDAQVRVWSTGTPIEPHRPVSVFTKDELLAEMAAAGSPRCLSSGRRPSDIV
jgi:hypothetical protein